MNNTSSNSEISDLATDDSAESASAARRRLRGFAIHMAVFFVVILGLGGVNFFLAPGEWWFVFPMVLWGAPLAVHAAYAMGLFRTLR